MTTDEPGNLPALPEPVAVGTGEYIANFRTLKGSPRSDVDVAADGVPYSAAFGMLRLREFFAKIDEEAQAWAGDPVALTHALARLDVLARDVRATRDSVQTLLAGALEDALIRRLTVQGIATVEGVSSVDRTGWQHHRLLTRILADTGMRIMTRDGELMAPEATADIILHYVTPSWKVTALRSVGIDPDDFCDVATGDDGKAVATPGVKMVDNSVRDMRA